MDSVSAKESQSEKANLRKNERAIKGGKKSSKKSTEAKKEQRMRTLIRNAKPLIRDAKALGADVSSATELIKEAEISLASGDYQEVPILVRKAKAEVTQAKRYFRGGRMIRNVIPVVDQANEMGADVSEAMESLQNAKTSLEEKNFGAVSINVKNVRNAVRRAKKRKRADDILQKMRSLITKSEKSHIDVSRAVELLLEAEKAFSDEKFADVQKLSQRLKKAIADAKLRRKMEDKLQTVRMDLEELKAMGVDTSTGEEILEKATQAMEEGKYAKMQNLILRNRRWITRERKRRETEVLMGAVGTLLEKASRGGQELLGAKQLLRSVKKAILSDKVGDIQEIVQRDLEALETEERKRRTHRRFLRLKNLVMDISEYGEDITELEETIEKVKRAFEEEDVEKAEAWMEEIERHESMSRLSKRRAENLLHKAKSSIMVAQNLGMEVSGAEELLLMAENLLGQDKFLESMERAKDAHQIAERRTPEEAIAKKREIEKRLAEVRVLLDESRKASIDVSDADASLSNAEVAIEEGKLREAEDLVSEVEKLEKELTSALEDAAKEFISSVRSSLERLRDAGISAPHVEAMYSTAEDYLKEGKFQAAIEYAKMAQKQLEESERTFESSAIEDMGTIKQDIEQARETGAQVSEAEALLEEAIDAINQKDFLRFRALVEKAEGSLGEAESIYLADRARRELEGVQLLIEDARNSGIGEVAEAEIVIKKAVEAYQSGNYGIVSMLTDTAKEMLGESKRKQLIQRFIGKSKLIAELVDRAEEAGVDASDVQGLLKSAQESFGEDNYESALTLIEQSENIARNRIEKFLKERHPNVLVNLPKGAVQSDVWNKYIVEVSNVGNVSAQDVRINLKGDFEVKGLKTIASLLPEERKKMEVGLKPKYDGELPVDVSVSFKKPFDETSYVSREDSNLNISRLGTYLVDDVFLVHNDGRLILHETREYREDVDEDIFSGMLTVMQEFVKDSFKSRVSTSLSRLDFGDNKIVIERGFYIYLATVLTGEEPALLPLYMAEIVKEIEEKYADVLDDWSGMMSEMEGVADIVRKIIFVSDDENAEIGDLEASMITSTLQMMREAQNVGADVSQAEDLLHKAKQLLEKEDYASAWKCVEEAAESASKSKARLRGQLENALVGAQNALEEAKEMGLEVENAEPMLDEAEKAVEDFDVEEVNSIVTNINKVVKEAHTQRLEDDIRTELERAEEVMAKIKEKGGDIEEAEDAARKMREAKLEKDFESAERYLHSFREAIGEAERSITSGTLRAKLDELSQVARNARSMGIDISEVEKELAVAEEALKKGEDEVVEESLEEMGKLIEGLRNLLSASEIEKYLESVRDMIDKAKSIGIEVTDAEEMLEGARQLSPEDVDRLRSVIEKAEDSASHKIVDFVKGRAPDINLNLPAKGLQADVWNKYILEVANEGNIAARNLDIDLSGDFEVKGLERIEHIDAKEKKKVEVGLKPSREGEIPVDVKVSYQKYFDEKEYHLDDLRNVTVESQGTYLVEDVFLIHKDGRLIVHETRKYREEIDEDVFSGMLSVVQDFVKDSFRSKDKVGLKRLDFGESKILMERGKHVSVASVVIGQEPALLPLHVLEVIHKIEQEYGKTLESWSGMMRDLAGIDEHVKELIFVTDKREAATDALESSLVTATFGVEGAQKILEEARKIVETEDLETAWDFVSDLGVVSPEEGEPGMPSPEVTLSPEFIKELGDLAESPEFRGHIATISEIVQCVSRARLELDLGKRMPIKLVAIKTTDEDASTMISDFKRVLQGQLKAKDLVIVPPGQDWNGLDLEIIVNSGKVQEQYPQWSRKIETLLKSLSPWKIKSGLDKGGYAVGIEGQKVSISPSMVSYEITLPEHVGVYEFGKGKVYVDKRLDDELRAEGFAEEIIERIESTKKEAGMGEENPVEIKICISDELKVLLEDWLDEIASEVRCTSFKFRPVDWKGDDGGPSVELQLGDEGVRIYLKELAEA
jgi:tetratricopeptide (TPR) repeat protein